MTVAPAKRKIEPDAETGLNSRPSTLTSYAITLKIMISVYYVISLSMKTLSLTSKKCKLIVTKVKTDKAS